MPLTIQIVNPITSVTETFVEVTTWRDGMPITSADLGALYFKDTSGGPYDGKYFRLAYDGPIPLSRWNLTQAIFLQLLQDLGNGGGTIYFDRELLVTSNLNLNDPLVSPAEVALQFAAGKLANVQAGFNVNAGVILTISPSIIAGDYQIFYGTGVIRSDGGGYTSYSPYTANMFWFGVLGLPRATDKAVETAAFQRYVDFCAKSGGALVYIRDGRYEFSDPIDFTGCKRVMGETINTTLVGGAGRDVCYWKSSGEAGYLKLEQIELNTLRIVLTKPDGTTPVLPLRVGYGGELIKQCGIFMPGGFDYQFDRVYVTQKAEVVPDACGFFSDGQAYKLNFGSYCEFRGTDYGVIVGASEKSATIQPRAVTSYNPATGVFTMANSFAANYQMTLIWDNSIGDITGINPRGLYYIVNPTATTFQVSATASGPPIVFTTTATLPPVYVFQAGNSSVEFACDEWASLHLVTRNNKCGFSAPNLQQSHFGTFGCQSTRVAARILSYNSVTRLQANAVTFKEIYTEGPQDAAYMQGKEYMRFEGEYLVVETPLRVYNGALINIYANKSIFNGFTFNTSTPRPRVNVFGNNNLLGNVGASQKETSFESGLPSQVSNMGSGNEVSFSKATNGGDTANYQNILMRSSFARKLGGFFPDYLLNGNPNSPYLSENVLFHPALSAKFDLPVEVKMLYRYDAFYPLGINGYARLEQGWLVGTTNPVLTWQMAITNPLGSSSNAFQVGQFIPRSRWRLYALTRSLTVLQNITISVNRTLGTPTTSFSKVYSVGTDWTLISLECDHSTASVAPPTGGAQRVQLALTSVTEGFELAYFVVVPYAEEKLAQSNNFGAGRTDSVGAGSPEGVLTAAVGSTYRQNNGLASTTLWVKSNGAGNTGWLPQVAGLSGSAVIDFPSVAAGGSADFSFALAGAAVGDAVSLGMPNGSVVTMGVFMAWVSAADTVTVRFFNLGTVAADPASATFKVKVLK